MLFFPVGHLIFRGRQHLLHMVNRTAMEQLKGCLPVLKVPCWIHHPCLAANEPKVSLFTLIVTEKDVYL